MTTIGGLRDAASVPEMQAEGRMLQRALVLAGGPGMSPLTPSGRCLRCKIAGKGRMRWRPHCSGTFDNLCESFA